MAVVSVIGPFVVKIRLTGQFFLSSRFILLSKTDTRLNGLPAFLSPCTVEVVQPLADMSDDGMVVEFAATRLVQSFHAVVVGFQMLAVLPGVR